MNVGSPVLESVPVLSEAHIIAPHFEYSTILFSSAFEVEPLSELKKWGRFVTYIVLHIFIYKEKFESLT